MNGRSTSGAKARKLRRTATLLFTGAVVLSAWYLWFDGLRHSPLMDPERRQEERYATDYVQHNSPDLAEERRLAESYWRRYRDVREDAYWGKRGPMGIWGPRDHFRQHGKREGRIFQPILETEDAASEKGLAESYWRRYPDIADNPIWGRNSTLGILGPRDHWYYRGRFQGRVWAGGGAAGAMGDKDRTSGD